MASLPLLPHQIRAVKKIVAPDSPGQLLYHGVGSGKTLASIASIAALKKPTTVVVPAALVENYRGELRKWLGEIPQNVNVVSQQKVTRDGIQPYDNEVLVVDEAHRSRAEGGAFLDALRQSQAKKKILLSGTPQVNTPRDIAPLINLIANREVLPEKIQDFKKQYYSDNRQEPSLWAQITGKPQQSIAGLKNVGELRRILRPYVDYHGNSTEGFPSSKEEVINVPMSDTQADIYKTVLDKAPWWVKWKVRMGLPPGKGDIKKMQAFLSGARQVSNSTVDFVNKPRIEDAPKIQQAFNYFQKNLAKNPNYKAIVYANFLRGGLDPYRQLLIKNNIPYGEFTGQISDRKRQLMVKQYNENKLKALLLSQAAAEGLSLKGTRLVQLLHPEFNTPKEQQIIARGIRYRSHDHLPESERNVLIQRYLAAPRAGLFDKLLGRELVKGTDEYIYNLARKKEELTNNLTNVIKTL